MRNFDINRLPCGAEEDGSGSSSALSMVSSSPLLSDVNNNNMVVVPDVNFHGMSSNDECRGVEGGSCSPILPPRKKLRLSKEQAALLEESFRQHHTLNPKQKNALAKQLNLKSRQVEVWFQNRRARTKLKQTEVDCEVLKRCCETLTEENRRLKREVEELKAMKAVGQGGGACVIGQDLYMPLPAATLTMCPSCERVGTRIDKRAFQFSKPSFYLTNFRHPSAASC